MDIRAQLAFEATLTVGMPVIVRWGYGLGFRAEGPGVIAKINPKSMQVTLTEDVPFEGKPSWLKGFTLTGIPRCLNYREWNEANGIFPREGR
mgnify:FL=1